MLKKKVLNEGTVEKKTGKREKEREKDRET